LQEQSVDGILKWISKEIGWKSVNRINLA
jgi:hypothetical protein